MSLSLAYDIARSALSANGAQTSVVSRNIQNVGQANSAHKSADLVTLTNGGVGVARVSSAINQSLFENVLDNGAAFEALNVVVARLGQLQDIIGTPEEGRNFGAQIAELRAALQMAGASPNDMQALQIVVERARDIARGLSQAATAVHKVRSDADVELGAAAGKLEALLQQFEEINGTVVAGTHAGHDVTDGIDQRNALMRQISELIGIRASVREGNDVVLFAANGATLFETTARQIAFARGATLVPGSPGEQFSIDGVSVSLSEVSQLGGRISGLIRVRDDVAVTFGRQLDEIARVLVTVFAEKDQSAIPTLPDVPGLFTLASGAVPPPGAVIDGLAAQIAVHANVDPVQGGDVTRLRDGGISNPALPQYTYNSSGGAGFSDRLLELQSALSQDLAFDPSVGLGAVGSVSSFAADSAGWLSELRRDQTDTYEDKQVAGQRAVAAWQNAIGINLDDELTDLIALERSFQASSRLITTVNTMFDALLNSAR